MFGKTKTAQHAERKPVYVHSIRKFFVPRFDSDKQHREHTAHDIYIEVCFGGLDTENMTVI